MRFRTGALFANRGRWLWSLALAGGAALAMVGGYAVFELLTPPPAPAEQFAYRARPAGAELPELWRVPAFSFRDQQGKPSTERDLLGHVWIADFIFTSCTTVCPMLSAQMVLLQRSLPHPELRFVSFSVDPAHDTPEVLQSYARRWRGDETRWALFATDPVGLKAVAEGMRVAVMPTNDVVNPILHSSMFFLVDVAGMVRGVYSSSDPQARDRLLADVSRLGAGGGAPAAMADSSEGEALYRRLGCAGCHDQPQLAPALAGSSGKTVSLEGGTTRLADAAYVRDALLSPGQELVSGYLNIMPSYEGILTEAELDGLVRHVLSLGSSQPLPAALASDATGVAPERGSATAPATRKVRQKPAPAVASSEDPVCHMKVRITAETPRVTHAGQSHYFCSEMCRDEFVAHPQAHLAAH